MRLSNDRHCSPDELVDLAEGVRPASEVPHLAACATCRQQLRELQAMLAEVGAVPVPEPSPLFWGHFSARVREAVAAQAQPASGGWRQMWRRWWVMLPAAAAVGAVLLAVSGPDWGRSTGEPALTLTPPSASNNQELSNVLVDDLSIELIADLASAAEQDAIDAVGLDAPTGVSDLVLVDLSSDEQIELKRLLREALGRPGV